MTHEELLLKIEKMAKRKRLSKKEWEEYNELVKLQYETGANDPIPDQDPTNSIENT